jgi:rRNA maturation endonuclease Nob1
MYYKVIEYAEKLKERFSLTDFEALDIATKIEMNEEFSQAFLTCDDRSVPNALEAIGMALGYKKGHFDTIPNTIAQVSEALWDISGKQ